MKRVCLHVNTVVSVLLIALFLAPFGSRSLAFGDDDDDAPRKGEFIPTGVHSGEGLILPGPESGSSVRSDIYGWPSCDHRD